ncbi:MAG: zinc metallopeptidase [Phycisphaerae bacterium]|nr:zinc metallopeptidase [Phycisphaerae bacterium]NUQ44504.1 zinc metallopeptidase [Phycisphaerae bacterium]
MLAFYFDPMYFVFVGPAILLALWAQLRVKSAFASASQIGNARNMSGAEAARRILLNAGIDDVGIEESHGMLSDHYDPRARVLRLSPEVYHGRSLASVGVAAHEAGHAIQHACSYSMLRLRSGLVPLASAGGMLSWLFIFGGFVLMSASGAPGIGQAVLLLGIGLFGLTVLFQIVNLPVEFDASRRAKAVLVDYGIVSPQELSPVNSVLSAAALTYVAATLSAVLTLLYYLYRAGLLGGRRD